MRIFGFKLPNMTSLILWGLLWEVLGRLEVSFFLPPLSSIFTTLLDIYDSKAFIRALNETAIAFFGGSLLCTSYWHSSWNLYGKK